MLEVKPNKEILKIKNTMFLGFTGFQFAMIITGLVVGTILFLVLPVHEMIKVLILVVVVGFFTTAGVYSFNGMSFFSLLDAIRRNRKICRKPLVVESEKEMKKCQ